MSCAPGARLCVVLGLGQLKSDILLFYVSDVGQVMGRGEYERVEE